MEDDVMQVKEELAMEVSFGPRDDRSMLWPHNDVLVITDVAEIWVTRTIVDTGSSVNVMYYD